MRFLGPTARHLLAGGLLGLMVVLASWVDPLGYFSVAELKALDSQFELRGPLPASSPIVIVGVDEGSNDELELPWPWPRSLHAKFFDIVSRGRPAAIGLDLLFAEPSGRGQADDEALAAGIKRAGNVVLAAALTVVREPGFVKEDLNPPIPRVREGAAGFGIANFETDADAFLRRASLSRPFQERMIPSFDLLVLREAGKRGIRGAGILPGPSFLINYRGGLSERLAPEDVVKFLREYLTVMTDAVFAHGGTVDKYIGDAIMALYNVPFEAPDHAAQAVRTALEFQRRLEGLAARFGSRLGAPLRCGVGIHTGDAVAGALGSAQRLEYTAIGDTVNLGSRLESITKEFDVPIVISEATWVEVKELFRTRYLGEVTVKGKEVPVKIYTVLDDEVPTRSAASPSR